MSFAVWRALAGVLTGAIFCQRAVKSLRPEMRSSLETGTVLDVHCRGIFAPIGVQVCDGSYIALVMKKVNGPTQAKTGLEWATRLNNTTDAKQHLSFCFKTPVCFKTGYSSPLESLFEWPLYSRGQVLTLPPHSAHRDRRNIREHLLYQQT